MVIEKTRVYLALKQGVGAVWIPSGLLPGPVSVWAGRAIVIRLPMDCGLPGSSFHGDFWGNSTGVGFAVPSQRIFDQDQTWVSLIVNEALPSEATREVWNCPWSSDNLPQKCSKRVENGVLWKITCP